ncbi:uncharacterized protein [Elaeis guineensis]|uniref:Uncharacterized protein LOC105039991 n=1 Tax=Elaeis guineensis var. tenera TaxID=51953 RepID=A0A6I9QT83_ELAGV|nr:uncharacterized protein LOC105039991 [Elaeis guineensis]XP_029118820.1 uncharacterized protein LOC105039991 [Elaeis guineensis]
MSISPNSPWRGCAANFPQPVNEQDELAAQFLVETVYYFNCRVADHTLPDIEYRSSGREEDIVHPVFRWDATPYEQVFENGFQARRQQGTRDEVYYNLDRYVHHGGRPLDSRRPANYAFVSTTISSTWHPTLPNNRREMEVYRYEIYAPGGIWVAETLGARYGHRSQEEVTFVAGIAPQYIRSAQHFRLTRDGSFTEWARVENVIRVNRNFNPQLHPSRRLLNIQSPVFDYLYENDIRANLIIRYYPPQAQREKRQVSADSDSTDWYARDVANFESYINAAFRSSRKNEAYLFMKNEYVLLDYAPGSTDDRVVNGPHLICDGYPSLTDTAFAEYGIDCAFGGSGSQAFIFSANHCAEIDYAPHTTNDKIIKGPMTIAAMFPFFKKTVFESGVDAAFESTKTNEAYLFKGNQYALINYGSDSHLIAIRLITEGFPSLKDTDFKSGIEAAFASHMTDEAYLFKGDSYALINFAPGTTDDKIIGGVKKILPNWPSLRSILPRKNRGLDLHHHTKPVPDRDHDEL